jgi:protein-L-isoaspartate(D-aspartate) O-methyltransferase
VSPPPIPPIPPIPPSPATPSALSSHDAVPAAFLAALLDSGALRTAAVEHAFATVPRHRCVTGFFTAGEGWSGGGYVEVPQQGPVPSDLMDAVYADHPLVTHMSPDGRPTSSSSTPSLMARMLEALRLEPGMNVLEIGAGTGYNAALLSVLTAPQGTVTSVDTQPEVVAGALATLRRLNLDRPGVSVRLADGWAGYPAKMPYDRVIATVGVAGVSPRWLDQLAPDGLMVVPIRHGGAHPVLAVHRAPDGEPVGRGVVWTDFIRAEGKLADAPWPLSWPDPRALTSEGRHAGIIPELDDDGYHDLWFSLACLDPRVIRAFYDPAVGCGLADPQLGLLRLGRDAVHRIGDPRLVDELRRLLDRWEDLGRPGPADWSCQLAAAGSVLVPSQWRCVR